MSRAGEPPYLAEKLLECCLPPGLSREALIGDLREELSERDPGLGARVWYWSEVLKLCVRYLPKRLRSRSSTRGDRLMFAIVQDAKLAVRTLAAKPAFALITVLTLALGIGATTSMFSVVYGVLIGADPYPESERLMMLPQEIEGHTNLAWYISYPNLIDLQERNTCFEQVEAVRLGSAVLRGDNGARRLFLRYISPGFLELFGARAARGRLMGPEDNRAPGAHPVVVISHGLWQSYFGGDSEVIGRTVRLSGHPYTVIGVLNPEFEYPFGQDVGTSVDLWVPALMAGQSHPDGESIFSNRGIGLFTAIGRLADGKSPERAQQELNRIARSLEEDHPDVNRGYGFRVVPFRALTRDVVRGPLVVLMVAAGILFLIGCFNAANLVLARGATRQQELAVRTALGASRSALIRQMSVESLVLAVAGGALGILAAAASLPIILEIVEGSLSVASTQLPPAANIEIHRPVLLMASGTTVLAGLLFGVFPAFRVSRVEGSWPLASPSRVGVDRRGHLVRAGLVVLEMATATVLLAGSVLLLRTIHEIRETDLGFLTRNVLTFQVVLPVAKYEEASEINLAAAELTSRLEASPDVEWADIWAPARPGFGASVTLAIPEGMTVDDPNQAPRARFHLVGPEALEKIGIPILEGRGFSERDRVGSPAVAIVSESVAERLWPGESPIGKRLAPSLPGSPDREEFSGWEVVGVAADTRQGGRVPAPGRFMEPYDLYVPARRHPSHQFTVLVHSRSTPDLGTIQQTVEAFDPDIPVFDVASLEQLLAREEGPTRFAAELMAGFAVAAAVLSALGVYGLLAFIVGQRTRDFALRTALGANRQTTLVHVLAQGLRLAALGVLLGMGATAGFHRILASLIAGLSQIDIYWVIAAPVLLAFVAVVACLAPAIRATRIAPAVALKE